MFHCTVTLLPIYNFMEKVWNFKQLNKATGALGIFLYGFWTSRSFTPQLEATPQRCGLNVCSPANLRDAVEFCVKHFSFFLTLKRKKMPNCTSTRAVIMWGTIWKIPNHKGEIAKRWCIPQMPSSNLPSEQYALWISSFVTFRGK